MLKQYIIYERFCIIYNILQLYSTSDSLNEKGLILDWIDSMTLKVRVEIQFILSEYVQSIPIRAFFIVYILYPDGTPEKPQRTLISYHS